MKVSIAFCVIVVFSLMASTVKSLFLGKLGKLGSNNANNGGVTVINVNCIVAGSRNCTSTTEVCGRIGSTNVCTRFPSDCELKYTNCGITNDFTEVASTFCTGLTLNVRRRCNGIAGNVNSNGVLSNLLGGLGSTSNVYPIIIKRG